MHIELQCQLHRSVGSPRPMELVGLLGFALILMLGCDAWQRWRGTAPDSLPQPPPPTSSSSTSASLSQYKNTEVQRARQKEVQEGNVKKCKNKGNPCWLREFRNTLSIYLVWLSNKNKWKKIFNEDKLWTSNNTHIFVYKLSIKNLYFYW